MKGFDDIQILFIYAYISQFVMCAWTDLHTELRGLVLVPSRVDRQLLQPRSHESRRALSGEWNKGSVELYCLSVYHHGIHTPHAALLLLKYSMESGGFLIYPSSCHPPLHCRRRAATTVGGELMASSRSGTSPRRQACSSLWSRCVLCVQIAAYLHGMAPVMLLLAMTHSMLSTPCSYNQGLDGRFGLGKAVDILRGSYAKGIQDRLKEMRDKQGRFD